MDVHEEYFSDFLLHYEYVKVNSLQSEFPPEVQQSPYVVVAHIVGIVSTNAVELKVEDHTGTAILALRGESAFHFYEEHLRSPDHPDPIADPYALNASWFGTYVFLIDSAAQITIDGNNAFIVPKLCMRRRIVDQFCHYQMNENDCECYRRAKAVAVPCGNGYGNNGVHVSPNDSSVFDLGIGTRKRVYAPYMP